MFRLRRRRQSTRTRHRAAFGEFLAATGSLVRRRTRLLLACLLTRCGLRPIASTEHVLVWPTAALRGVGTARSRFLRRGLAHQRPLRFALSVPVAPGRAGIAKPPATRGGRSRDGAPRCVDFFDWDVTSPPTMYLVPPVGSR